MKARVAVFLSGSGTNLQALLDQFGGHPDIEVVLVVSDRPGAGGLERARAAGVDARVIAVTSRPVAAVTADTVDVLDAYGVDVVALAGYLRLLPPEVVRRYAYRILNVHPALLPAFGGQGMYGRRVHEAVLASGARVSGPTVHFVDERYDAGRILAQWPVPVLDGDTPETLARRVLRVEHALYPAAVEWLARVLAAAEGEEATGAVRAAAAPGATEDLGYRLTEGAAADVDGIRRMFGAD